LQRNRPEVVWDFLPAGYQRDVNDLVHDFADRMDPELWASGVRVVRKLGEVIKTKKAFVAQLVQPNPGPGPRPDWDELAHLFRVIAESDLGDLDRLKKAEARNIVAVTGGT